MSIFFKDSLKKMSDLNLVDFSKFSQRGIEKESLRVNNSNISTSDHPKILGAALTNPYITTDFSEALLELITAKAPTVEKCLPFLRCVPAAAARAITTQRWCTAHLARTLASRG